MAKMPHSPNKKLEDCKFFMADTLGCTRGLRCPYRHSSLAWRQEKICRNWLHGVCGDRDCGFRHPGKSSKVQSSECPSCMEYRCSCGYGNPSVLSSVEQKLEPQYNNLVDWSSHVIPGCTFSRVATINPREVTRIRLSPDGRSLATFGQGSEALLKSTRTLTSRYSLRHSAQITEVCYSPACIASSSTDETVKLWDVNRPATLITTLTHKGDDPLSTHKIAVLSLDFHPTSPDLLCSIDRGKRVFYWNIQQPVKPLEIVHLDFKGIKEISGVPQIRFQPGSGRLLAAAGANHVFLLDSDTGVILGRLEGHKYPVLSLCWNESGQMLASVSEDLVKVWDVLPDSIPSLSSISLNSSGNNVFRAAVFHPAVPGVLVLGLEKALALWPVGGNHDSMATIALGSVQCLTAAANMLGSCHGDIVKIWSV